jgi:prevent-host-death family protein
MSSGQKSYPAVAQREALIESSGMHYFIGVEPQMSAAEANRRFSELLRRAREGQTTVITSHGRPVARLVPMTVEDERIAAARRVLFDRLRQTKPVETPRWTRAELYDEP